MMKKMGKFVMDPCPSSSSSFGFGFGEEARVRFKHQALLQDYEELLKETEAKRRQLKKTIQKKLVLTAEIKFLRSKFKSFTRNQAEETPYLLKKLAKKMPPPTTRVAQHQKTTSPTVRVARPPNGTKTILLPLQDTNQRSKEAETPRASVLFDLNKVSLPNAEEMEGFQPEWEPPKVEALKRCSVEREAVAHDLNPSIFKDVGNIGSSGVGKRKISWQDQVALRV